MRRHGVHRDLARRLGRSSGFSTAITTLVGILAATVPYSAPVATIALRVAASVVGRTGGSNTGAGRPTRTLPDAAWTLPWWAWMVGAAAWIIGPILRADVLAVVRSAFEFGMLWWILGTSTRHMYTGMLRRGLVVGGFLALVGMAVVSTYQVGAAGLLPVLGHGVTLPQLPFGPHPQAFPGRVAGWLGEPNQWGAWAALLGIGLLSLRTHRYVTTSALAMATVTVFASGSRSALVALFIGMAIVAWLSSSRTSTLRWFVALAVIVIASWVAFSPYGGRFDVSTLHLHSSSTTAVERAPNLFLSSEDVLDDRSAWLRSGVSVVSANHSSEGAPTHSVLGPSSREPSAGLHSQTPATVVTLTKDTEAPDARVYQAVTLHPGMTYTLSAELRPRSSAQRPGLAGWGRRDAQAEHDSLNAVVVSGALRPSSAGDVVLTSSDIHDRDDGWLWLRITFSFEGPEPITWRVGPTVDQRPSAQSIGSQLDVRRLQLVVGDEALAYAPTTLRQRQQRAGGAALAVRVDTYRQTLRAIRARPLAGWGDVSLAAIATPGSATRAASVGHAHNVVLDAMVRHGVGGLVGLVVVFLALVRVARRVGWEALALLASLVTVNIFDSLFWPLGIVHLCATLLYVGLLHGARDVVGP